MDCKLLLTITGPSGSGKTSVLRLLEKVYGIPRIISCTTRAPRQKEEDGIDYHFLSLEEYCNETASIIAPVHFAGNYYGIRVGDIRKQFEENNILAVIVEPSGAEMLKEVMDNGDTCVRNIYIDVPPKAALSYRARRDGWAKAKKRQKADMEAGMYLDSVESSQQYDCILSNDRTASVKSIAYDVMNYIEALRFELRMQGKNLA